MGAAFHWWGASLTQSTARGRGLGGYTAEPRRQLTGNPLTLRVHCSSNDGVPWEGGAGATWWRCGQSSGSPAEAGWRAGRRGRAWLRRERRGIRAVPTPSAVVERRCCLPAREQRWGADREGVDETEKGAEAGDSKGEEQRRVGEGCGQRMEQVNAERGAERCEARWR